MRINFLGDFVAKEGSKPQASEELSRFLTHSNFNVVNVEAPVFSSSFRQEHKPYEKSGPSLWQPPTCIEFLKKNNIQIASLANNHIMDYGSEGLDLTRSYLDGFEYGGAGTWHEAYRPITLQSDNMTVGIICLTHQEFGTLTDRWDNRFTTGTAWVSHPDVDLIIDKTRKEVDYLFIYVHAGVEYSDQPLPEWRDRYRSFVRLGADAVIASHPHVPQGWEMYQGVPIIYSLGNFYFPERARHSRLWYISLCASFTISSNGLDLSVNPLSFADKEICFDKTQETSTHLLHLNDVLADDEAYISYINELSIDKMPIFESLFAKSGYITWEKPKRVIRSLLDRCRGKQGSTVFIRNNVCCESHRWLLARAMKLNGKYQ